MKKYTNQMLLAGTVMIWGSLYVATRIVLKDMSALFLLFLRFAFSSAILLIVGKVKRLGGIRREDFGELVLVGVLGYFISNAALLLGIEYSNASFSSLINATCPIFITLFAAALLKERIQKKDILSLGIAVAGAMVIIGSPGEGISSLGILFGISSPVIWAYTTIHIKKLTEKYDPLLITAWGMGIAAVLSLPTALMYGRVMKVGVEIQGSTILPLLYICLVCTVISHLMWNHALSKTQASKCAFYYPIQPMTSMVLGSVLLQEKLSWNFLMGAVLIIGGMVVHGVPERKC